MVKNINIGVIGLGRIGQLHTANIVSSIPEATVISVADICLDDEKIAWAQKLGVKKIFEDAEKVIADPEIDAVLICSSTDSHSNLIIKSARAGKHIFCEKPLDFDIELIDKALKEVESANVKLQVGFVRRFDHNHKKVRDVVSSGKLGKPHIIKVTSRDPEPPPIEYVKVSGGLFMDMMIHDFDMVRYLSGSEVTEVSAYGDVLIDDEIKKFDDIDTAIVMMKLENGSIGVIDNSRRAGYGYDQRTEVHCEGGCVQVTNDYPNTSMISTPAGVFLEKPLWFFLERYNEAFISEINSFIYAISNNENPLVDGNAGLMPVKIALAAKKSLVEGRSIKISEI
ncbi:MAG: inositol 2-dehydrogenase [Bacillota bacterium]|nr:inositol 2-dehydrogenase [Bacillota bacterium]